MPNAIGAGLKKNQILPSFAFTTTNGASAVEIVPTGRECLLTHVNVRITSAGAATLAIEDKAGGDLWAVTVGAAVVDLVISLSFPHPPFSDNGMQTNPTGISSCCINVGYVDLESGII